MIFSFFVHLHIFLLALLNNLLSFELNPSAFTLHWAAVREFLYTLFCQTKTEGRRAGRRWSLLWVLAGQSAHNTPVSEVVFGLICLGLTAVLPTGAPLETAKRFTALIFFFNPSTSWGCDWIAVFSPTLVQVQCCAWLPSFFNQFNRFHRVACRSTQTLSLSPSAGVSALNR